MIACLFFSGKVLNSGKKLYTAFIDYEKCFDKVNRAFLWQKLVRQGVSTKLVNAIKATYSSVKSSIKFNDQISAPINSLSGLKQGDSNSSLLFIMFVNDIIDNIKYDIDDIFTADQLKLFLLLFTDDQALFSTSPSSLQSMLTDIENYCDKCQLKINTTKTKVMIFDKGRCNTKHNFFLYNEKLENVKYFKYLGIYFSKNGSWLRSQKKLAENASKSLYGLLSTFNNFEFSVSKKFCYLIHLFLRQCTMHRRFGRTVRPQM